MSKRESGALMVLEDVRVREGTRLPGEEKDANANGLGLQSQGQPRPKPRSHPHGMRHQGSSEESIQAG